jgi:ribosomal subunit interface protein
MGLRISGKSVDIGQAFRNHVEGRIETALEKYFDGGFSGHVTLEREGSGFKTDCAIHLDTGIILQATGFGQDARESFDQAAERIEKRLRRYKRRLKDYRERPASKSAPATEYVIAAPDEETESVEAEPTIIAEEPAALRTLSVSGAVMALDLAQSAFVVFRHAANGGVNIVYRRSDGHIGWIDPSRAANKDDVKH